MKDKDIESRDNVSTRNLAEICENEKAENSDIYSFFSPVCGFLNINLYIGVFFTYCMYH